MPTNLPCRRPQYDAGLLPAVLFAAAVTILAITWVAFIAEPQPSAHNAPPPVTETR
jgi:hypothetical protein